MALGFGAVRFSAAMTPRSAASLATRIARFDVLIMAQSKLLTIPLRTICPPDPGSSACSQVSLEAGADDLDNGRPDVVKV